MLFSKNKKYNKGFSLVEIIVASAVFAIVSISVYQAYSTLVSLVTVSRVKIIATDLINEQFELARNLSYTQVGLQSGIPSGPLLVTENVSRGGFNFEIDRTVRNIDDPFDGTIGGSPNDLSPADYKLFEITISCNSCKNFTPMVADSYISPKNLETASTNGALLVKVFDANGNPVSGANVHIQNIATTVSIVIDDVTDNNGTLEIVDVPPGSNAYRVSVTKSGYTTDRTYATSSGNQNPFKPDATVLLQQLTQVSFNIDRASDINVYTVNDVCATVPSVSFNYQGNKLIGASPIIYKWSGTFSTDSFGKKIISNIDWDSYGFTLNTPDYLEGVNPVLPVPLPPNSSQSVYLTVSQNPAPHLVVAVKDASTGLPISGASVRAFGGGFDQTLVTSQGYFKQTDWSGGPGQNDFSDKTKFYVSDGNISYSSGNLTLSGIAGTYVSSGVLTSSVFDTGTSSNFTNVYTLPASEPLDTTARIQVATSPDNTAETVWNYKGPDGTGSSYYNSSNTVINPVHGGDRYFRYKIFLDTSDTSKSPIIADFVATFSSACIPPGQVDFYSIPNDSYNVQVTKNGYQVQTVPITTNSDYQYQEVLIDAL